MVLIRERRRRQRIDIPVAISIAFNGKKISTASKNISILGAYIELDKEIPIGTSLNIGIKVPFIIRKKDKRNRMIRCKGIAFRCQKIESDSENNQYGAGIFFRSFSEGGEKYLSNYIKHILLQEKKKRRIVTHKRKTKHLKRRKGGK